MSIIRKLVFLMISSSSKEALIVKVKCTANTGKDLSSKSIEAGDLIATEYDLKIGDVYTVYGISLWKGALQYLTMDKYYTLPFWFPSELFEIVDHMLPFEWYHKFFGYRDEYFLNAIWGYKELVFDEKHYSGLIDRNDEAVCVFLKRKKEIEEFND